MKNWFSTLEVITGFEIMYSSSLTDESLVKIFLDGDEDAFTQLYERYWLRIYIVAFQIILNLEEAQDATQEIFIKIYRSLDTWNVQRSKLSTWIYRVAVNHSIDHLRVLSRRAESRLIRNNAAFILQVYRADNSADSPFIALRNKEEIGLIRRTIEKLPDLQKKAFIGRYFKDLGLGEIAELEQCKIGAVKSALHRATHAVRHILRKSWV
ncbi:MAG: RNA polymerase sigma factor [Acidobacteriota bacterium]|jgi:RNA polymerase sigma-70 factor (ECF subfamily)